MSRDVLILAALGGLLASAGCQEPLPPVDPLVGSAWRVTRIGDTQADAARTTLAFDVEQRAYGDTGCNRFNGSYELDHQKLRFGPMASTRRACEEPVMDQEHRFLAALANARSYEREGGALVIRGSGDSLRLTPDAAPDSSP